MNFVVAEAFFPTHEELAGYTYENSEKSYLRGYDLPKMLIPFFVKAELFLT
ncbi:MAG: hypothetical protein ABSB40_07775 [Nitrososphaeria archaeon]